MGTGGCGCARSSEPCMYLGAGLSGGDGVCQLQVHPHCHMGAPTKGLGLTMGSPQSAPV